MTEPLVIDGKESTELTGSIAFRHPPVVLLDGSAVLPRDLLGNKGYGINAMRREGLPVPPAFCITTEVCAQYFQDPAATTAAIRGEVREKMRWLEAETARTFGAGPRPLLVSVRSGAAQSMPGMLDTVLDLGIDDAVESALSELHSPEFAQDTRQRFCKMYRRIVLGSSAGAVPDDPFAQLGGAVGAVFSSWHSPRAAAYRKHHGFKEIGGTAVVVQAMVFGNMDTRSGTGVLFSRNPMTGASEPFGEWLACGQGEDVVSGTFDVEPVAALRAEQPMTYDELMSAAAILERLATDVQDIEFTVEQGKLWLLQTRVAKRSAQAAVRLALEMRDQGIIDDAEVLRRVSSDHVETLLQPSLQPETRLAATLLATGLPACPGVVSGIAYTDVDEAIDAAESGQDVILVRSSTSPDDIHGMMAARGIVTEIGGATSHAAVVSRELHRPTVVGCGMGTADVLAGREITVDGTEGEIREGLLELTAWSERDSPDLLRLTELAREHSPLRAYSVGEYPMLPDGSADGVRAALTARLTDVVSPHPLITMLTALCLRDTDTTS
ncbi:MULTISPECIES: pyruvate, phosphate dikinase [unclassified Mycobacterium]|uniref:pyruvate, phosphate dikinase n=1 Tax=unclassified Mycobacterium TaxID=2642494 RepID=UPI0029C8EEDC|nr:MULTISPECIES: pyruvate, phosphate dikinase [unclassified Mycobacterium]